VVTNEYPNDIHYDHKPHSSFLELANERADNNNSFPALCIVYVSPYRLPPTVWAEEELGLKFQSVTQLSHELDQATVT
jgi:hypothetical protein